MITLLLSCVKITTGITAEVRNSLKIKPFIIMVRLDLKYLTWRALIAPPLRMSVRHGHAEMDHAETDHADYEFDEILAVLYSWHVESQRKIDILARYPELFALSYDPETLELSGSFFHSQVRTFDNNRENRFVALSSVEAPSPVIQLNWHAFFSYTHDVAVPTLKDFLACANIYSRDYNENLLQYENLAVDQMNRHRIPNVCYLPPAVAIVYLDQPDIEPLALLHSYLKEVFGRMPEDNPIILGDRWIVLGEDEDFPDGAYYDTDYALPFYPSMLFLWYIGNMPFLNDPSKMHVSREVSTEVFDHSWGRMIHDRWLWTGRRRN